MKILMLNYEFPPIGGGAGQAHQALLEQYAGRRELTVDVLTSAPTPGLFVEKRADNITIHKVGLHKKGLHFWRKCEVLEWLAKAACRYRRLLRENTYDLAHAFFGFPTGWLCYRTAKSLPYILSLRGSDVPGYNVRLGLDYKLLAGLFRRIWSRASAVVANSEGLKDLALPFMPHLDIRVIPNGIDAARFHPSQEQLPAGPLRVLTVCRLIARKRIDVLIHAAAHARELGLDLQLNIAGDGNLLGALETLAAELNVTGHVVFRGRVEPEDMPRLYRDNDIFVMTSAHEGMSNAMLEAMASGLPIVTTRCEGVDELIADNGVVVEGPDPAAFARAMEALAKDGAARQAMAVASRKRAEQLSWTAVADQYINLYRHVVPEGVRK